MVLPLNWPHLHGNDDISPFDNNRRSGNRLLRITLHSQALNTLPPEEATALEVIREFALSENIIDVGATSLEYGIPHFVVSTEADNENRHVISYRGDGRASGIHSGVHVSRISTSRIAHLSGGYFGGDDNKLRDITSDLLLAEANRSLQRDIFVTNSQWLLKNRQQLEELNIRLPSEAIKVIGLYLRSRNSWLYRAQGNAEYITSREGFYWTLTRAKLPEMWRYHSACYQAQKYSGEELYALANSALVRCARALQARDEIGYQFYSSQNADAHDATLYHFDYLTLLLFGIFDAQALVAKTVYNIHHPDYKISLKARKNKKSNEEDFLDKLQKEDSKLHDVITTEKNQALLMLLSTLRNTIHDIGMSMESGTWLHTKNKCTLIQLPDKRVKDFSEALGILDQRKCWGAVTQEGKIFLKPYPFTVQLVEECFSLYNAIAKFTELERLFNGQSKLDLQNLPPTDLLQDLPRVLLLG